MIDSLPTALDHILLSHLSKKECFLRVPAAKPWEFSDWVWLGAQAHFQACQSVGAGQGFSKEPELRPEAGSQPCQHHMEWVPHRKLEPVVTMIQPRMREGHSRIKNGEQNV